LFGAHPSLGLYMYNNDMVGQPPPAHTGIPLHVDPKTGTALLKFFHETVVNVRERQPPLAMNRVYQ